MRLFRVLGEFTIFCKTVISTLAPGTQALAHHSKHTADSIPGCPPLIPYATPPAEIFSIKYKIFSSSAEVVWRRLRPKETQWNVSRHLFVPDFYLYPLSYNGYRRTLSLSLLIIPLSFSAHCPSLFNVMTFTTIVLSFLATAQLSLSSTTNVFDSLPTCAVCELLRG